METDYKRYEIIKGYMYKFHLEVVKMQRWDLTPITRAATYIYLN